MFEKNALLFWYAVSPVHMGAGTAVGGLIDNPIQREVHTGHPLLAGSGLKGALREVAEAPWLQARRKKPEERTDEEKAALAEIDVIFGPPSQSGDLHAGALAVSDAQIVAFPVRALRTAFVWVTCPTALARLKRLAELAGVKTDWQVPDTPGEDRAKLLYPSLLSGTRLVLEAYAYEADVDKESEPLGQVASWLADHALPPSEEYKPFRDNLKRHLVLVRDEDFGHFVRFSTSVEPHVRIDDDTGTADDGGLFYTENLPPETILASLLMASKTRNPKDKENKKPIGPVLEADKVLEKALQLLNGKPVQIGGDATTGRGLMVVNPAT